MTDKAKPGAKSFRSLNTHQTLALRKKSAKPHHLANRFAGLENERARLGRELAMWETRARESKNALLRVDEQLAALYPMLTKRSAKHTIRRQDLASRRARGKAVAERTSPPAARAMPLEY